MNEESCHKSVVNWYLIYLVHHHKDNYIKLLKKIKNMHPL